MGSEPSETDHILLRHILVPVASAEDARASASALTSLAPDRVTVLYVVEKGGGVPDKTPVEQSEAVAEKSFEAFRERFPSADDNIAYRRDIVAGIIDRATEIDASAIVFRPRGASRIVQFLAGDKTLRLIAEADLPVIALPDAESDR